MYAEVVCCQCMLLRSCVRASADRSLVMPVSNAAERAGMTLLDVLWSYTATSAMLRLLLRSDMLLGSVPMCLD